MSVPPDDALMPSTPGDGGGDFTPDPNGDLPLGELDSAADEAERDGADDGLLSSAVTGADVPPSAPVTPPVQSSHDAEETAPAFNPLDPESSWMAFLAPPTLEIDEAAADPSPAGAIRELDPEATAAALPDTVQGWMADLVAVVEEQAGVATPDPDVPMGDAVADASLSMIDLAAAVAFEPMVDADAPSEDSPASDLRELDGLLSADPTAPDTAAEITALEDAGAALAVVALGTAKVESPARPPVDAAPVPTERPFEDLSVADALGQLWRHPLSTIDHFIVVMQSEPLNRPARSRKLAYAGAAASGGAASPSRPRSAMPSSSAPRPAVSVDAEDRAAGQRLGLRIGLLIVSLILGLIGTGIMQNGVNRSEADALFPGIPFLIAALVVAVIAESVGGVLRPDHRKDVELRAADSDAEMGGDADTPARAGLRGLWFRIAIALAGTAASVGALILNSGNMFTLAGFVVWLASVFLWVWVFAPAGWTPVRGLDAIGAGFAALGRVKLGNGTFIALVIIMAVGAYLRLIDLDLVPREMTSDHVEMILDANRILNGQTNVFFSNIGGREPIQFYLLALISGIPGLGLTFTTQKLLTALEGVLLLPILWWLGRELIGPRQPRFGNAVGLIMAGLTAVSYWDLLISRLGERIALTPIFISLILIFLIRALRYGRRWDFILTGLFLGFGLYSYQVIRMMPVVIVGGVLFTVFAYLRSGRVRASLLENLVVVTVVAFVIFVPLFGYSLEYPEDFWRRTSGRLFGDEVTQTTNDDGQIIYRTPTIQERASALVANFPQLALNLRNAVLMYNWKGDVGWFQNYPNTPAFDVLTGALLVSGVGLWIGRMIRRRDGGDWTVMLGFGVLLLPSALSIAYPIENPSVTRMSGTLPIVFLWAAYPLAQIVTLPPLRRGRVGGIIGAALVVVTLAVSAVVTQQRYFVLYNDHYLLNAKPHSDAGDMLADFAASGPGFGNAFMIAYVNWWDHRAVGMEAGRLDWPNTIPEMDALPRLLQQAYLRPPDSRYRLNVNFDLLFFYHVDDLAAEARLLTWFPAAYSQELTTYQAEDRYRVMRVPALGEDGLNAFLQNAGITGS